MISNILVSQDSKTEGPALNPLNKKTVIDTRRTAHVKAEKIILKIIKIKIKTNHKTIK